MHSKSIHSCLRFEGSFLSVSRNFPLQYEGGNTCLMQGYGNWLAVWSIMCNNCYPKNFVARAKALISWRINDSTHKPLQPQFICSFEFWHIYAFSSNFISIHMTYKICKFAISIAQLDAINIDHMYGYYTIKFILAFILHLFFLVTIRI